MSYTSRFLSSSSIKLVLLTSGHRRTFGDIWENIPENEAENAQKYPKNNQKFSKFLPRRIFEIFENYPSKTFSPDSEYGHHFGVKAPEVAEKALEKSKIENSRAETKHAKFL